jgi:hypothetical protein
MANESSFSSGKAAAFLLELPLSSSSDLKPWKW